MLANPLAGCLATDAGLGYTWAANSQANRLTPWSNDSRDPPGEAIYLRDVETGQVWTPAIARGRRAPTVVCHGAGFSSFVQRQYGLATGDRLRSITIRQDHSSSCRNRRANAFARATFYAELVLGSARDQTAWTTVTEIDGESGAIFARNAFNAEFGSAIAFVDTNLRPRSLTGDRLEFLGRNGSLADPAGLRRTELSGHTGAGLDPCAAILGSFEVPARGQATVIFVLGQTGDAAWARQLAMRYRQPEQAVAALSEVVEAWNRRLAVVQVKTPDVGFDALVNRWLPYQVLACRLWGRSAFYQSGGAYGFRDQLQDVLALLYAEPGEARAHLLRAASRQFKEGDVQHWWHPPSGRGVRTRFSDDFLWLPYAVARFVDVTGDTGVLDERVGYLRGPALNEGEHESYYQPDVAHEDDTLYVHCLRERSTGAGAREFMGCR